MQPLESSAESPLRPGVVVFLLASLASLGPPPVSGITADTSVQQQNIFRITASVSPVPVNVGQSANLTCQLESIGNQRETYSVYWHDVKTDVAENCIAYNKERFEVTCNNANHKLATVYMLKVKKVQWTDRGIWLCKFVTNVSSVFVDVNYPATIDKFMVTPIPASGQLAAAAAAGTQPKADGSAAAPYDLTNGGGLNLTCRSSCGYPAAQLQLEYQGVNVQLPSGSKDGFRVQAVQDNSTCPDAKYGLLTTTQVTAILPNCSALQLDGKTRFRCSGEQSDTYSDIYVNCPVIAREYPLTQGEIAAASVGAVLGVFLIILGFVLFCKRKPTEDIDESASQPMQV